jgi:hypothetical protein
MFCAVIVHFWAQRGGGEGHAPGHTGIWSLVLGVLLFVFMRWDAGFWTADVVRTRGSVVSHSSAQDSEGGLLFKARVQFTDAAGRVCQIDDWISFSSPRPREGGSVDVEYVAADSANARVRHPKITAAVYVLLVGAIMQIFWTMAGAFE